MKFICKQCAAAYDAAAEPENRLCPDCQKRMEESIRTVPDWKGPLEAYARSKLGRWKLSEYEQMREMFIRLGDMQTLKAIDSQYRQQYESAVKAAKEGTDPDAVKQAAAVLEQMNGYEDSCAMAQAAHQRAKQLQTEAAAAERAEQLRRKKRTRMQHGIVFGVILVSISAFVIHTLVTSSRHLRAGDSALAAGAYEEALEQYEKAYEFGVHTQQAAEGQRKAREGLAEQMMAEGNPDRAAELFHILGDSERENTAKAAWAEQKLDAGDFKGAFDLYWLLNERERVDAVCFAWSESLSAEGDFTAAIETLSKASESPERTAQLETLRLKRADQAVETVLAHDADGSMDPEFAAAIGSELTTLSAQLRFCRGLYDAGYDLHEVYPEGVAVEDVVLDAYLPWSFGESDEVDYSRALLFERKEIPDTEYSYTKDQYADALEALHALSGEQVDGSDDDSIEPQPGPTYSIRLLPGQLFGSGVDVADSWDDATYVILVDGSYMKAGEIEHQTTMGAGSGSFTTIRCYPYYAAFNNIAVYDKNFPQKGMVYDSSVTTPVCYDDTWFEEHKDQGNEVLAAENRFAEFDLAPLSDSVEDAMFLIYLYYLMN